MKWDLAEQYLPWRFFIGKSLQNGVLPFWNPFQLGGYPAFADPQSGTWYYPAWLIGGTLGYSMKIIELEILSFILIGGLGLYSLSNKLGNSKTASLIISVSYIASGFFVGNAQHLTWIAAAAWIPVLFSTYHSIRNNIYTNNLFWFLLVLYLFVSSSYPAFVITSAYIILIDQLILFFKSASKIKFVQQKILLIAMCIVICFPVIYSVYTSSAYFSRGAGITIEKSLQHPFSFQSLLSLIAPFSSFKNADLFKTDISMSNAYIGLFPLILLSIYIFSKKNKNCSICLVISFIFFMISIGDQSPLRKFLFDYLPGFNLFRFPSLFRLFFIISFLLFSAAYYDRVKTYFDSYRKKIIYVLISFILFFLIIIIANVKSWHPFPVESLDKLFIYFDESNFKQHLIYQLALQTIVLIIATTLYLFNKRKFIVWLICIELFLSVRLNSTATIVSNIKTKNVDELILSANKEFHVPKNQPLLYAIDQQYEYRWPLNWNMNCYYSEIAIDGYNPFVLNTFNELSDSKLQDSIWKNAWYFFPSKVQFSDTPQLIQSNTAWVNDAKSSIVKNYKSNVSIDKIIFKPNSIQFDYNANDTAVIVLAQNPYPGWNASIDGETKSITNVNFAQQMVKLNPGKHQLTWEFKDKVLNWIFTIHICLFFILLIFASINSFKLYIKTKNTIL